MYAPVINISYPMTLYRGDGEKPPGAWDKNHRGYMYDGISKNPAGNLFFTDSVDIARAHGRNYSKEETCFYLTECETKNAIYIIDFSHCWNIFQMILTLEDLNLNVLTNEFKTHETLTDNY